MPASGTKRKLPDNPTPEMLKKLRMGTTSLSGSTFIASGENNVPQGAGRGKRSSVTMEEVEDEDAMNHDFAPGGDADYFAEEDDDGRFFGGGLTSEQKEILNIFDGATNEDDGVRCLWLRTVDMVLILT